MQQQPGNGSEIARLREQIAREHEAACWGAHWACGRHRAALVYYPAYGTYRRASATSERADW